MSVHRQFTRLRTEKVPPDGRKKLVPPNLPMFVLLHYGFYYKYRENVTTPVKPMKPPQTPDVKVDINNFHINVQLCM